MTEPLPPTPDPETPVRIIDGKYEVIREVSQEGNITVMDVRAAQGPHSAGLLRRVAWFGVGNPADRQQFHTYRAALRAISPAGLTDVVARPGAYYAVWQEVSGTPLDEIIAQPVKRQEVLERIEQLAEQLAEHGFALSDADIVMDGLEPNVAYLRPAPLGRRMDDIQALNASVLSALSGGRIRKKRKPAAPGAWLTFVPGIIFLITAGYMGARAGRTYLNPPLNTVKNVVGMPAKEAAQAITRDGFRVEYNYGDTGSMAVGVVMRQEPPEGTNLKLDRVVTLTVNKPSLLTVPKLEEMTLAQAETQLKELAMKVGKVLKVDGTISNTPEGRIVAQSPGPGANTQRGRPVELMISTGVRGRETWMVDLRGMTFEQAREHARAAGLVVTQVTRKPSDQQENIVLEQSPAPFVRVPEKSRVRLVISSARYTPPSTPTERLEIPPLPAPTPGGTPADPNNPAPQEPPPLPGPELNPSPSGPSTSVTPEETTPTRQVRFNYIFPNDLPDGSYSVVVQDADGEHLMMEETPAATLRGKQANASWTARGNAVFIIRSGGAEYARVNPE